MMCVSCDRDKYTSTHVLDLGAYPQTQTKRHFRILSKTHPTHLRVLRPAIALPSHGPPVDEEPPRQVKVRGGGHLLRENVKQRRLACLNVVFLFLGSQVGWCVRVAVAVTNICTRRGPSIQHRSTYRTPTAPGSPATAPAPRGPSPIGRFGPNQLIQTSMCEIGISRSIGSSISWGVVGYIGPVDREMSNPALGVIGATIRPPLEAEPDHPSRHPPQPTPHPIETTHQPINPPPGFPHPPCAVGVELPASIPSPP